MYDCLDKEDALEICEMASDLLQKYGDVASRVAREWAVIKESQGSPLLADKWLLIADAADRLINHLAQD